MSKIVTFDRNIFEQVRHAVDLQKGSDTIIVFDHKFSKDTADRMLKDIGAALDTGKRSVRVIFEGNSVSIEIAGADNTDNAIAKAAEAIATEHDMNFVLVLAIKFKGNEYEGTVGQHGETSKAALLSLLRQIAAGVISDFGHGVEGNNQ